MKKYLSIVLSLFIVVSLAVYVKSMKEKSTVLLKEKSIIGTFNRQKICFQQPNFLKKLRITSSVAIDLSQQRYKGLAFLYGYNYSKAVHLKSWEKFDHFSAYTLTPKGNMFLTPMPYISIKEKTFEFQKNIYRIDSSSGKLSIWMRLEDVHANSNNPYGVTAIEYDCDDNTLWVSAIDETDYRHNRGVIYHIDINSRKILQKLEGVDALSIKLIKSEKGKFLLLGMARESSLYAYSIIDQKIISKSFKLFTLSNVNERIRKIIIKAENRLKIQTINFSYSLIAQTQEGSVRKNYILTWNDLLKIFLVN